MNSRTEQFSEYAESHGFPESMINFAFWNALQDQLEAHEMQPPETAPKDRRIIVYDDAGKSYCAEYECLEDSEWWKITSEFWLFNIAGWKEIP